MEEKDQGALRPEDLDLESLEHRVSKFKNVVVYGSQNGLF